MKKIILASVLGLALLAIPSAVEAAPPAFYGHNGGRVVTSFPSYSSVPAYNYSLNPNPAYRAFNYSGFGVSPWGVGMYNYRGSYAQPYVNAPYHSVYWNPYIGTYQYGTGYLNTPTYFSTWGWGW
jgi:hypothetical protein